MNKQFALNLSMEFRCLGDDLWLSGCTEKVAADEVLFRSHSRIEPESRIEMVLRLPVSDACNVECIGTVLRLDMPPVPGAPAVIAATIERYCFVRM